MMREVVFLRVSEYRLEICTWNFEGLTDVKLKEIQEHMLDMQLGVLCLTNICRCAD